MTEILTYHRKMAPFESSWLILLKALTINDISLGLFVSIATKKDIKVSAYTLRWYESFQFSSPALCQSLRLPSQVFENAFLDRLMASTYKVSTTVIRHCQKCIENLYHCSLFQLPWVTECPVHQVMLRPCKACSSIFKDGKLKDLRSKKQARICSHLWPFMQEPFAVHTLSVDACSAFSVWGESLASWFKKCCEDGAEDLLAIVSLPLSGHAIKTRFMYWRYMEGRRGAAPINIPAPEFTVRRLSLECLNEPSVKLPPDDFLEMVSCFKCLRRHIYKRFVRPHLKCVKQFKKLTLTEGYVLEHNARCSCTLAYYSWLITMLNLYTMQDLTDPTVDPYAISGKFHKYAAYLSVRHLLLKSWMMFHDHWGNYEFDGWSEDENSDLEVHIRSERTTTWPLNLGLMTYHAGTGAPKNCYIPSGDYLLCRSLLRCTKRQGRPLISGLFKVQDSSGLLNISRPLLFILRRPSEKRSRYLYI